eukprot:2971824-Amphidinium_carterae.1
MRHAVKEEAVQTVKEESVQTLEVQHPCCSVNEKEVLSVEHAGPPAKSTNTMQCQAARPLSMPAQQQDEQEDYDFTEGDVSDSSDGLDVSHEQNHFT